MAFIVVDDPLHIADDPIVVAIAGNPFTLISCVAVPEQPRLVPVSV